MGNRDDTLDRAQDALRQGKLRRAEALTEVFVRGDGAPLVTQAMAFPGRIRPLLEELLVGIDARKGAEALLALAAIAPAQARLRADRWRTADLSGTTRLLVTAATLHWNPPEAAQIIRAAQERSSGYEARLALDLWDDTSDESQPEVLEPFLKITQGRARAERRLALRAWALGKAAPSPAPSLAARINAFAGSDPSRARQLLHAGELPREELLNVVELPQLDPSLCSQVLDSLRPDDFLGGLPFEAGAGFLPYISDAQFGALLEKLNGSGALSLLQSFVRAENGLGPRSSRLLRMTPQAGQRILERVLSLTSRDLFELRLELLSRERTPAAVWLLARPEARRLSADQLRQIVALAPEAVDAPELLPELWAMRVRSQLSISES